MRKAMLLTVSLALTFTLGCGGGAGDMPQVGTVTGTVTLDGQPVSEANIVFNPVSGGRSATAVSDSSGKYTLQYLGGVPGAVVGQNEVLVSTGAAQVGDEGGEEYAPAKKETIPAKYHNDGNESELKVEVKAGDNTIDLKLTS